MSDRPKTRGELGLGGYVEGPDGDRWIPARRSADGRHAWRYEKGQSHTLLTAWGTYEAGGDPGRILPKGLDTAAPDGVDEAENKLAIFVTGTPGYADARAALHWVYIEPGKGLPPPAGWKAILREFVAAIEARLPWSPGASREGGACEGDAPPPGDAPKRTRDEGGRLLPGLRRAE